MNSLTSRFQGCVPRYLDRPWASEDGLGATPTAEALRSAGVTVPESLRAFYETLGSCTPLLEMFAEFVPIAELGLEDEFLVFADEDQGVVSWGFRSQDLHHPDPTVWQRDNADGELYDEERTLIAFLSDLFDFATGHD